MTAAVVFFVALAGPCLYAAWSDLRRMTIPNTVVLACLGLYVVLGPMVLPFEAFLWRFVPALPVLVAGFRLHLTCQFGAGDAKFATVLVLFVAPHELTTVIWIYAILSLLSVGVLFAIRRAAPAMAAASSMKSLNSGRAFPLGLPLALTIMVYLALVIRHHLMIS